MKWNIKTSEITKVNKTTSMKLAFIIAMLACAFFAVFVNIMSVGFTAETLLSASFWSKIIAQNAPLVIFAYLVFNYSVLNNELNNESLLDIKSKIKNIYQDICNITGRLIVLDDYVSKFNKEQKLFAFKREVHFKLAQETDQMKKEALKKQLENAEEEAEYANVIYYPVNIRLLFSHVDNQIEGDQYTTKKSEEARRLMLFKISTVVAVQVVLTSFLFTKGDSSFTVIVNALMALFQVIATYVFSNMAGKEYVEGRELSAYQARFNFLIRFEGECPKMIDNTK